MECTSCGSKFEEAVIFCPRCGKKLPEIIKEQINQEIKSALEEIKKPDLKEKLSTPSLKKDIKSGIEEYDTGDLSYETDDFRKIEYKKILKEVFADGIITAEEVILLASKIRQLGLDKTEAQNVQTDVAKELGLSIDEEGDLASSNIVVELNTNKAYFLDEIDDLEFRITNISDDNFEKFSISSYLMNLKTKEEKIIGSIKKSQKKIVSLPFSHNRRGNEKIEVCLNYVDPNGNPSVYKSEFRVRVLSREEEKIGTKSLAISFTADKIMANDFSNMAEIFEKDQKQIPDKRSSYEEFEKLWRRLPVFFDEEETNKRRNELVINKKLKEGENKLQEGERFKKDAESIGKKDIFERAFELLNESKECFEKILELDQDHSFALERTKEIKAMISEVENRIGILTTEPAVPPIKLSSGCLSVNSLQKKIYLYSKNKITIGRDSKNDMVLRLIPYHPKEEYPENWQKSSQISGLHAEIINKSGQFYIRDIRGDNKGSTNGIFIDGKRLKPLEDYLLRDNTRINFAKVLDLECSFLGEFKKKERI